MHGHLGEVDAHLLDEVVLNLVFGGKDLRVDLRSPFALWALWVQLLEAVMIRSDSTVLVLIGLFWLVSEAKVLLFLRLLPTANLNAEHVQQ